MVAGAAPLALPVMVSVYVPRRALAAAERVRVDVEPLVDAGLKPAVTPEGSPLTEKLIVPAKLPRATVTPNVVDDLRFTVRDVGVAESVKPAAGMVSVIGTVRTSDADVPVTVSEYEPGAAVPVLMASVVPLVPEGGVKVAVAPDGSPWRLKTTVPANPPVGDTVIAEDPPAPRLIVSDEGCAESEKSAAGATVSETTVERVRAPLVPFTVSV